MSRTDQKIGKAGQEHAAAALRRAGVSMVEQIATPISLIPSGHNDGTFRVQWGERVSGDHRGILEGSGRSVLAETKTVLARNLQYSDLREHQPDRLTLHHELGGVSLLVWVHHSGIFIMRWPIAGFEPHTSITPERAELISTVTIASDEVRNRSAPTSERTTRSIARPKRTQK